MSQPKKIFYSIAGIIIASLFALFLFKRPFPSEKATVKKPEVQQLEAKRRETIPKLNPAVPIPFDTDASDPNLPIIDEVLVEKTEMCRGEENSVTIKAHTRNGSDAFLSSRLKIPGEGKYILGGMQIPFTLTRSIESPITITVEGNAAVKSTLLPRITVKDCDAERQVTIKRGRSLDAIDRVMLTAELKENAPASNSLFQPLVPKFYEWDFGDGQKQTTTTPQIEHGYEAREQNKKISSFIITVTLRDGNGQAVKGSTMISLSNLGFLRLLYNNEIDISTSVKSAPPDSKDTEKISLYHGYPLPITIEKVSLVETQEIGDETKEISRSPYNPEALLGLTVLQPRGVNLLRDLSTFQPTEPNTIRYVEFEGKSADGKLATGSFSLLPPKQAETNPLIEESTPPSNEETTPTEFTPSST